MTKAKTGGGDGAAPVGARDGKLERFRDAHGEYWIGPPELWHGELQRQVYDANRQRLGVYVPTYMAESPPALSAVLAAFRAGFARGFNEGHATFARQIKEIIDADDRRRADAVKDVAACATL